MNRPPPADLDAEAAVLSAIMNDTAHMSKAAAILRPDDFHSPIHASIFTACVELYRTSQPVDLVTVVSWMKDNGRLSNGLGSADVISVINAAPVLSHFNRYMQIVRNKARVRATIDAAERIVAEGYAGGAGNDADWLAKCSSSIIASSRLSTYDSLTSNKDSLVSIVLNMERNANAGVKITGIPTGIDCYDRLTLGLHAKQLTVIAARPGMGKTALGANIACNVAQRGIGVMFFSLEMSREEILFRQMSALSGIDGTVLKIGQLSKDQWGRVNDAASILNKIPLWIDDRTSLTMSDISSIALGAIDESHARKTALGLIVVDYLQKVNVPRQDMKKPRYEQVGDIAKGLKQLARDTGMPVIALAQLKRLGDKEQNKRPTLESVRESGDAEQEADNVTLLHYPDPEKDQNVKELLIEKARGGRQGCVKVKWTPELTLFGNLPDEPASWY